MSSVNKGRQSATTTTTTTVSQLSTPAFLVREHIVHSNVDRMKERAKAFGLRLRPHIKTHKTIEGALLQTESNDRCVVISTLAEAELLVQATTGIKDILYAVPIVSRDKLDRIVRLMIEHDCLIHLEVDNLEALHILSQYAAAAAASILSNNGNNENNSDMQRVFPLSVFVNVNSGGNREGCDFQSSEAIELVQALVKDENLKFAGLYTHGGHSYGVIDEAEKIEIAEVEASSVHHFAHRLLHEFGIECPVVSLGSTPTCSLLLSWDHLKQKYPLVNEIHPGNYIFYDYMMAQMGNCAMSDIAVTVLTTVISKNRERRTLLVDAGALALSKDLGVRDELTQQFGYGAVKGHSNVLVKSLTQEMGVIQCPDDTVFDQFKLGDKIEIYPNHSCLTAAMFSEYHIVDLEDKVIGQWHPCRGW